MQVFIVGSPLETAKAMVRDTKRFNKQIVECQQILDALNGSKAWSNHPCTLQYRGHENWLQNYMSCLMHYRNGDIERAKICSEWCNLEKPSFHTKDYFNQMKRRLYTKDLIFYAQWMNLGMSEDNWYFVDGEWRIYRNGKRVK